MLLPQAQLDAEVLSLRRELSAEYRRRLDALEAEWATRASTRSTELESAHALKLQQVRPWHVPGMADSRGLWLAAVMGKATGLAALTSAQRHVPGKGAVAWVYHIRPPLQVPAGALVVEQWLTNCCLCTI